MVPTDLLKEYPFFKGFSDAQLAKLAAIAEEVTYEAGAQMYRKGDPAKHFFVVEEGKVVMVMDSYMGPHRPPMQVTIDIVAKGEVMGWSAVVEPHQYIFGALCIDKATLIAFEGGKLRQLMEEDPSLGFKVMQETAKVIATRLNHTTIILVGERGLASLTDY
jgi:CRP/FNR family transcriptional regulator, cyclic AMP receptor protein